MLQQCAAGLRRRHALAAARQQRGSERLFHVADSRARCGERQMRALRAMRDAARLDHVAEQAQVGKVKPHASLRITRRFSFHNNNCNWEISSYSFVVCEVLSTCPAAGMRETKTRPTGGLRWISAVLLHCGTYGHRIRTTPTW